MSRRAEGPLCACAQIFNLMIARMSNRDNIMYATTAYTCDATFGYRRSKELSDEGVLRSDRPHSSMLYGTIGEPGRGCEVGVL